MLETNVNKKSEKFNFNGNEITFQIGNDEVMVNATEMAKPFGKHVKHWFENPSTHEFIHHLAEHRGYIAMSEKPTSLNTSVLALRYPDIIKVVKGGLPGHIQQGTWFHEDVALEFARWLSPAFAIWCNDRIKELLKIGFTATPQTLENIINDPDLLIGLATQLKLVREEKNVLENKVQELEPKRIFADAVSASSTTILVGELAKLLKQNGIDMGQQRLFEWLRNNGYLIKRHGTDYNMPTQKSMELELFIIKETSIARSDGHISISKTPKVTGKGQSYFINKFLSTEAA